MKIKVIKYDKISSTMEIAKKERIKENSEIVLIVAKEQTNGRGRGNNFWFSPTGGFYGTFIIPIRRKLNEKDLAIFHYTASLVVFQTLKELSNCDYQIKWPNDILFQGKKIAGILLEYTTEEKPRLLVGVGINNHSKSIKKPKMLKEKAIWLDEITQNSITIDDIISKLNIKLLEYLIIFNLEDYEKIKEEYNNNCLFFEKFVKINQEKEFFCRGISLEGKLILESMNTIQKHKIGSVKEVTLIP
ncbi:MAG: biotin--[acetyl-CoA-carboxylase] ligase [Candidatus Heimdallarchaeaceae archaeon]